MGFDLIAIIKSIGYLGVWSIIFSETGILFGVLLPGDMLLFAVGVLSAQGTFDIRIMAAGCFIAAFIGNLVGYELGRRWGLPFIKKICLAVYYRRSSEKNTRVFSNDMVGQD